MQKNIQPELFECEYVCAACGSNYKILSTKGKSFSLDICANCHPFYIGSTSNVSLGSRAKLSSKFDKGREFKAKKSSIADKVKKEVKSNIKNSFSNL